MGRVSEAQINEAIANFDYEGKLLRAFWKRSY